MRYLVAALIALPLPVLVWMIERTPQLGMLTFFVTVTLAVLYLRSRSAPVD